MVAVRVGVVAALALAWVGVVVRFDVSGEVGLAVRFVVVVRDVKVVVLPASCPMAGGGGGYPLGVTRTICAST